MQVGEAVVRGVSPGLEGSQNLDLHAVCPAPGCERLNVVVGTCRVAVDLDRPGRGAWCEFNVAVHTAHEFHVGEMVGLEFFYPGDQSGAHVGAETRLAF